MSGLNSYEARRAAQGRRRVAIADRDSSTSNKQRSLGGQSTRGGDKEARRSDCDSLHNTVDEKKVMDDIRNSIPIFRSKKASSPEDDLREAAAKYGIKANHDIAKSKSKQDSVKEKVRSDVNTHVDRHRVERDYKRNGGPVVLSWMDMIL